MSQWNDLLDERNSLENKWRKKYLQMLQRYTKRDVIVYYSSWQTKSAPDDVLSISQDDRTSFQCAIDSMLPETDKLDLILHTPGGDIQATKMIVQALRQKYDHIRVIVPITAMSAGTMIALSSDEIWMSTISNLGPIDPQIFLSSIRAFIPAQEIENVIEAAKKDMQSGKNVNYWVYELQKYPAAIYQMSQNATKLSKSMTNQWLTKWMFRRDPNGQEKADRIQKYFSDYHSHLTHGNHITYQELTDSVPDLRVNLLEDDLKLKYHVYNVLHCYDIYLMNNPAVMKICEGHRMIGRLKIFSGPQRQ